MCIFLKPYKLHINTYKTYTKHNIIAGVRRSIGSLITPGEYYIACLLVCLAGRLAPPKKPPKLSPDGGLMLAHPLKKIIAPTGEKVGWVTQVLPSLKYFWGQVHLAQ